jgi:hypothetical protein
MKWVHKTEIKNVNNMFVGKPKEKMPLGIQRCMQTDNIKIDYMRNRM